MNIKHWKSENFKTGYVLYVIHSHRIYGTPYTCHSDIYKQGPTYYRVPIKTKIASSEQDTT
jgi:hypothetical protein